MSQVRVSVNRETGEVIAVQPDGRQPVSVGVRDGNRGRARQSELASSDINVIVKQFRRGVVPSHLNQMVASYAFAPAITFRECMEQLRRAREVFDGLPAKTREFFANDPARFVDFSEKKENLEKLVELGLRDPEKVLEPVLGSPENPIHVAPSSAPDA